jgi:predicted 3-demethylubiquinone-9 3-methyltransferase (glyoxalase superfamily)
MKLPWRRRRAPAKETGMKGIAPFLWFDRQAEEAARFYTSIFPNSRITTTTRYGDGGPGPAGSIMTVAFELDGREFVALNGGPLFPFTPAVSFVVNCETQAELDLIWERLAAGGEEVECGWLRDRYGVSWQVVPASLGRLLATPDPGRAERVMKALLGMKKLDLAALERAAEG